MRTIINTVILMTLVVIVLSGCVDREQLFHPTKAVAPSPPESTWAEQCDTTWSTFLTTTAEVSTSHRTATRIDRLVVGCDHNLLRYGAVVIYSDSYDQKLQYYLQRLSDSNIKYYFADSLGRTTIPQPTNYRGRRYMMLQANNIPSGEYSLRMYYAGTITSPSRALPASVYGTNWSIETPIDTLKIGCIDCRLIKIPK